MNKSMYYFVVLLNCWLIQAQETENESTSQNLFGSDTVEVIPGIVAALAIILGLFYTFYGYRYIPATVFFAGFVVGGLIGYIVADNLSDGNPYYSWISLFVVGLLVGFLAQSLIDVGIFIIGVAGGILLAFFLHTAILYKISEDNPDTVLYVAIAILGIAGGLFAIYVQRPALIGITSFFGADATIWGIGYFAGDYPSAADLDAWRQQDGDIVLPNEWKYYFYATWALFFIGAFVQYKYTSVDYDHRRW